MIRAAIAAGLALVLASCATMPDVAAPTRPDAKSYQVSASAMADRLVIPRIALPFVPLPEEPLRK